MSDLATEVLELADAALVALRAHGVDCPTCEELLAERITVVEQAMADAIDAALAPDDEQLEADDELEAAVA